MIAPRLLRPLVAVALGVAVLGSGSALAAPKAKPVKLGPNLVVNPSFEESTVDPATANGFPVLPVGWTFEGATELFDYNQRIGRTGKRNAAITGALGGGKQFCDHSGPTGAETCAANPAYAQTHAVDEGTRGTYSVRPYWVTAAPIKVVPGARYRFSAYAFMPSLNPDAGVVGEGASTAVRWVDASGRGLSVAEGGTVVKGPKRQLGFKLATADLTAPAGAAGAVLMLGHTDYSHTGTQVDFDDISFQKLG